MYKKVPYDCAPPSSWDSSNLAVENAKLTEMLFRMCETNGSIFDEFGEEHEGKLWFGSHADPTGAIHNWHQTEREKRAQ